MKTAAAADKLAALRHCVYDDVLSFLPVASVSQTRSFMANLCLPVETLNPRFLMLRVSPEIGETGYRGMRPDLLMLYLLDKYGEQLEQIPGFYRMATGRLKLNLPRGCALHGYRSRLGYYNGILCQPLDSMDSLFLLSSAKYGGPKAIRMSDADEAFFRTGIVAKQAA